MSADPHSIDYTPNKDADDYTPPTSDIDMPLATTDSSVDGNKKGKATKGKGKGEGDERRRTFRVCCHGGCWPSFEEWSEEQE